MTQPAKEGYLEKLGTGIIKNFKKRYFILEGSALHYFNKPNTKELGKIEINSKCSITQAPECKKGNGFKLTTQNRSYIFSAASQQDLSDWMRLIQNLITQASTKNPLPKTPAGSKRRVGFEDFDILAVLGGGTYGKVQLVKKKDTGELYAMKSMPKTMLAEADQIEQSLCERDILTQVVHPFLVGAHWAFQTDTKIFLILDYVPGGELFGRLKDEGAFSETRVQLYAAELVLGLGHLHSLGIIYRDLKPENILVDVNGHLRITDFGLAKKTDTSSTFCGTPEYIAPEILQKKEYDKAVDWWSFGVMVYEMINGLPPFYNENVTVMYKSILFDQLKFPPHFTAKSRDLLQKLLDKNPATRLGSANDAEDVKAHPFFADLNWDAVYNKTITPEWVPKLKSSTDTGYVDSEYRNQAPGNSYYDPHSISADVQSQFAQFTFDNSNALDQI